MNVPQTSCSLDSFISLDMWCFFPKEVWTHHFLEFLHTRATPSGTTFRNRETSFSRWKSFRVLRKHEAEPSLSERSPAAIAVAPAARRRRCGPPGGSQWVEAGLEREAPGTPSVLRQRESDPRAAVSRQCRALEAGRCPPMPQERFSFSASGRGPHSSSPAPRSVTQNAVSNPKTSSGPLPLTSVCEPTSERNSSSFSPLMGMFRPLTALKSS